VSCAKMAEPTEMQFGMPGQLGPGNMYFIGVDDPPGSGTFVVSGRLKSIASEVSE